MGHLPSGTQLNVNAIRRRYFPNRVIKMVFIDIIKVAARFLCLPKARGGFAGGCEGFVLRRRQLAESSASKRERCDRCDRRRHSASTVTCEMFSRSLTQAAERVVQQLVTRTAERLWQIIIIQIFPNVAIAI